MTKDHNLRCSDSEWTELIAECRRKNNGILASTFYNAVSRLRKKACYIPVREKQGTINLTASRDVVSISIISEILEVPFHPIPSAAPDAAPIQTSPRSVIEILTNNAVIRLSNGTDPQLLSHVLHRMGGIR